MGRGLILGIDPGPTHSAFSLIGEGCRPVRHDKVPNEELLEALREDSICYSLGAIEMIQSYGMAVGREVFDTCVWIGRFVEAAETAGGPRLEQVFRSKVRIHHCQSTKAKDGNVTQALVDRFTPGQPNFGKGTKVSPGWFYGFSKDQWQAHALAVYVADTNKERAS